VVVRRGGGTHDEISNTEIYLNAGQNG